MKLSILGARVIDPTSGLDQVTDLHIEACKVLAIGAAPAGFEPVQTIDATGLIAAPGLVDLNVALREPGYSRKGTIASETRAAAAGGVTSLCCPPRTKPILDTSAVADGNQSVILNQVTYGIAVRMAVLSMAMSGQTAQRQFEQENAQ